VAPPHTETTHLVLPTIDKRASLLHALRSLAMPLRVTEGVEGGSLPLVMHTHTRTHRVVPLTAGGRQLVVPRYGHTQDTHTHTHAHTPTHTHTYTHTLTHADKRSPPPPPTQSPHPRHLHPPAFVEKPSQTLLVVADYSSGATASVVKTALPTLVSVLEASCVRIYRPIVPDRTHPPLVQVCTHVCTHACMYVCMYVCVVKTALPTLVSVLEASCVRMYVSTHVS
jgi:hypothetical protein